MLKWFEFRHANPYLESKLSEPLRTLNYRISSGHGDEVDREEYIEAETRFRASYKAAHDEYLPKLTYDGLAEIEEDVPRLSIATNYRKALDVYAQLDSLVTRFEEVTVAAVTEIEYQSEMESDIRRGK
ncbi:MAG: hypothetical protein QOK37_1110 [Thermoanaerobaculia bacterium]|nr:hypothetical protein [Thermoanaerobaculia bacterium]